MWLKSLSIAALTYGAWTGYRIAARRHHAHSVDSLRSSLDTDLSEADLRQLAGGVKPGDVTLYTTTHCPYCAEAKHWLQQYGFAYTECDAEQRTDCAAQLQALGGMGVPFLMVKGAPMKDGFDSDEFVALLKR